MIMFVKVPEWDSPEQKTVRKIYYPESDSPKYQDGRTVPFKIRLSPDAQPNDGDESRSIHSRYSKKERLENE
jgi:hypothetical protein